MNEKSDPCDKRARNSHRDAGPSRIRRAPDELDSGSRIRIDKRSSANYHSRHGGVKWQADHPQWLPKPLETGPFEPSFFRNIWFDDERIFQQRTIIMTENFRRISLESAPRSELHDALGLTGCEVSVNALPAGAAVPFVHRHVKNEEVYGVLEGRGELYIDGEVVELKAGDWFRISPEGRRAIRAAARSGHPLRLHPDEGGGASRVLRTTTASPATKRRPGSEPTRVCSFLGAQATCGTRRRACLPRRPCLPRPFGHASFHGCACGRPSSSSVFRSRRLRSAISRVPLFLP